MERIIRQIKFPEDLEQLQSLTRQPYGDEAVIDPEFLSWVLTQNPDQGDASTLFYTMWEGSKLIASDGLVPCQLSIKGKRYRTADDVMSVTDKDYQRQGIFRTMTENSIRVAQDNGIDVIIGLANRSGYAAYERFGYLKLFEKNALIKPINVDDALQRKLKIPGVGRAGNAAWGFADNHLLGFGALRGCDVAITDQVPAAAGEFWDQVESSYDVAIVRDTKRLDYRYNSRPNVPYTTITLRRGGNIAGVAICRPRVSPNSRLLSVVEFFTDPTSTRDIRSLAAAITEHARDLGVNYIAMCTGGFGPFQNTLARCGFRQIKLVSDRTLIAKILNPEITPDMIIGHNHWHLSQGDLETDY